jgi:hypothetical protein
MYIYRCIYTYIYRCITRWEHTDRQTRHTAYQMETHSLAKTEPEA